jgi:hypothetical protein
MLWITDDPILWKRLDPAKATRLASLMLGRDVGRALRRSYEAIRTKRFG